MKEQGRGPEYGNGPLTEFDWNFDKVPDGELVACCLWEYARESVSIGHSSEATRVWIRAQETGGSLSKPAPDAFDVALGAFENSDRLGYWFYPTVLGFGGPNSSPWRKLPKKFRKEYGMGADIREVGFPLMPAEVVSVEELIRVNVERARMGGRTTGDFYFSEPLHRDPTVAAFEIQFRYRRDAEILEAFAQWLKENRPKDSPEPTERGHKLRDVRVALDRLGMMRLLHHHTLAEMPHRCPQASKAFDGYDWYKERKRALVNFRKFFPFLPKTEFPISWPTQGGRSR